MEEYLCPPVTVEGDWTPAQTRTLKNKLQLYFGSKKKSNGGDCRVELDDGAPTAAVYFRSEEGESLRKPAALEAASFSLKSHFNTL